MDELIPEYSSKSLESFRDKACLVSFVANRNFSNVTHSHDFYEFLIVFSGGVLHTVNGERSKLYAGDACLLQPGDIHYPEKITDSLSACMVSMDQAVFLPFVKAYNLTSYMRSCGNGIRLHFDMPKQQSLFCSLRQIQYMNKADSENEIYSVMGKICDEVLGNRRSERVTWLGHILSQMSDPQKLEEGMSALEKSANLSHSQLFRIFKRDYNQTPQQFLTELRLNYAYNMICSSDMPFEQIASMVGYSSFSHFSQLFKSVYQQTPTALRKSVMQYW